MAQAKDERHPLLERVRFIAILDQPRRVLHDSGSRCSKLASMRTEYSLGPAT
ncbi:MAG TPA: hypothetical protein VK361_05645 [Rubrobacteraceae bacterium]|nr:hypothetical protein [Rubrobacteraceae bacterium]